MNVLVHKKESAKGDFLAFAIDNLTFEYRNDFHSKLMMMMTTTRIKTESSNNNNFALIRRTHNIGRFTELINKQVFHAHTIQLFFSNGIPLVSALSFSLLYRSFQATFECLNRHKLIEFTLLNKREQVRTIITFCPKDMNR